MCRCYPELSVKWVRCSVCRTELTRLCAYGYYVKGIGYTYYLCPTCNELVNSDLKRAKSEVRSRTKA